MSKLETNTIDTLSGSTNLTLGGTNATDITIPSGVTLTNNGTQAGLTLSDNILFNTASKGIYLGVTSATASNLLDDYEEGTWTPEIYGTTTAGSWSPAANNGGRYIKIGNQVTAWFNANGTLSGAAGNMQVRTLPFANGPSLAGAKNAAYSIGSMQYWGGVSVMVNGPLSPPNSTYLYFHTYTTNSTSGGNPAVVNGGHNLHAFVTYYVS